MNLIIDIGNTRIKFAVFDSKKMLIDQSSEANLFVSRVKELFEVYPKIDYAIISSVSAIDKKACDIVSLFCKVHVLSHASKVPFKNKYATPESLGVDRIALATAALYQNPRTNTLVIDAGTCITYDFVNDHGEYLGGAISPGLNMRYRALNEQTSKLPLLKISDEIGLIGNDTHSSIHSGVLNGARHEVDGLIDRYRARFEHLTVILTGGDAHFFAKRLKNSIFANSKFLLEGLNYLLEYNKS